MGLLSMVRSPDFIFCFGVQMVRMFSLNGSQSPTVTITPALAAAMVSSQSPTAVKLEEPGLSTSVAQEDKWSRCSGAEAGEKQENRKSRSGDRTKLVEPDRSRQLVFQWQSSSDSCTDESWSNYDTDTQTLLQIHAKGLHLGNMEDPLKIPIAGNFFLVYLQDVIHNVQSRGRQVNWRTDYTRQIRVEIQEVM